MGIAEGWGQSLMRAVNIDTAIQADRIPAARPEILGEHRERVEGAEGLVEDAEVGLVSGLPVDLR